MIVVRVDIPVMFLTLVEKFSVWKTKFKTFTDKRELSVLGAGWGWEILYLKIHNSIQINAGSPFQFNQNPTRSFAELNKIIIKFRRNIKGQMKLKKKEKKKRMKKGKEEVKLSLFMDDSILYVENPQTARTHRGIQQRVRI